MGIGPTELLILLLLLGIALIVAGRVAASRRGAARPVPAGSAVALPAELQSHLRALAVQGREIQAVKQLREATGLGLLDAKRTVDTLAAGGTLPTPSAPRADLAHRARTLAAAGREDEAVRVVATETGMSHPEATAFVRSLRS